MSDIVERLRQVAAAYKSLPTSGIWATMTVDRDASCNNLTDAADEIERLRAEVAGLREDAERYRWLRDKQAYIGIHPHYKDLPIEQRSGWTIRLVPDVKNSFDAAIDAARKGEA